MSTPSPTLSEPTDAAAAAPAVELQRRGTALEASVHTAALPGTTYAFYLYRGDERVATRWYDERAVAVFDSPLPAGSYSALAFCRGPDGHAPTKIRSARLLVAAGDAAVPKLASQTLPPPLTAASVDAIGGLIRPRSIQRLDVKVGPLTYNLLTAPKQGRRLYVLLRGNEAERSTVVLPRFSRFSWRDAFGDTVVCVADPTLQFDANLRLGWYFGNREHDVIEHLARIVVALCDRHAIAIEDVCAYGSSGGGFAALQLAARLGGGATAIAVNPQTDILEYWVPRSVKAFTAVCLGNVDHGTARRAFASRLSALESWSQPSSGEARCLIVQNVADSEHYRNHFRPFADLMGIPDNGLSADGRMGSLLYDHLSGHAAEPREMVPEILKAAHALRWQPGATGHARGTAVAAAPVPVPRIDGRVAAPDVRRVKTAPLSPRPTSDGVAICLDQLYLARPTPQRGARHGTIAYQPRADVPVYEITLPFDWSIDPFKDRNWNAQLHMWRLGQSALFEAERSGDFGRLHSFVSIMLDWHRHHLIERKPTIYAWKDMMVGIRAMKLAYVVSHWQHGHVALDDAIVAVLHELVETHLGFLLDPVQVRYSNHTLSDLHGALALARVVDPDTRGTIEAFVAEVFPKVLDAQFDTDGIHRENSLWYHRYAINYLHRLIATGWFERYGLRELVAKAEAALAWFYLPDGRMAAIGDTDGAAPCADVTRTVFSGRDEMFNRSGYVIVRDDGGGNVARASYLFFMGAYNSKFHKQSDDLSLIWFHGEEILCDAGKYAYKTDDCASYAISRRAHNTIEIDRPERAQLPAAPYGSAIKGVESFAWGRLIRSAVRFDDLRVTHRRFCLHSLDGWLLVIDQLDSADSHDYVQWSHFAPLITGFEAQGGGVDARLPSGRALSIRSATGRKAALDLVHGAPPPRRQGWISQAYRQLEPNMALGIRQRGANAFFATLYAVDAPQSTIERSHNGQLSMLIGGGTRSDFRLEVDLRGQSCTVQHVT